MLIVVGLGSAAIAQDHDVTPPRVDDHAAAVDDHANAMADDAHGAAGDAHGAAGDHGDGNDAAGHKKRELVPSPTDPILYYEMAWSLGVFLLFFGVLSFVVWPKVLTALRQREEKQQSDLARAETASREAQETLEQYQQQLAEARKESQQIIEQARAESEKLGAQLKAQAQRDASAERDRIMREIEGAKQQALNEMYQRTAEIATAVAGQIIRKELQPADHEALVRQSLDGLTEKNLN